MKRRLLAAAVLMSAWSAHSQVGIGTLTPNASSQLDVVANDKGVLLPRVSLTSTTDSSTVPVTVGESSTENSLLVFNTNTQNDVTPGYYYWYVDKWMRIVNEDEIIALDKNTTNQGFSIEDGLLILTDSEGNFISIPLTEINIPTTLVQNPDGTYTYTNEEGTTVTIDVPADVINNIEEILGDTNVLNELITVLGDTHVGGNVYYDGDSFTYVDELGDTHEITFEEIVQANETVTTLVDNNDGTYTYTNEAGDSVTIDVPASVVENFETIVNDGNTEVIDQLITVLGDTYVGGNVYYDGDSFTYVDELGDTHEITFEEIVQANETVTVLVANADGTYTYTNEAGADVIIDIPASVVDQFENIYNQIVNEEITVNGDLYSSFEEYLTQIVTNNSNFKDNDFITVTGDGTTTSPYEVSIKEGAADSMLITNEEGDLEWATIESIVQANETVTVLVANADGTYTYTNEAGADVIIDIPASVVDQFENIYNQIVNEEITVNGDLYSSFEEYLTQIVTNNSNFKDNDFITVTGDGTTTSPYEVSIKEGAADSMLITNEEGDLEWATIEDIVNNNITKGSLTVTGGIELTSGDGVDALLVSTQIGIADEGITTDKLANDAVTSAKIEDGTVATVDLANNAVTGAKIGDDAVTARTINPDVAGTGLSQDANGALQVDYTEVETALADGTISSATNGAITVTDGGNAAFKDVTLAVKAESGVEIDDDKVKLGGNLTRNTTITQNGNPFTIATGGSNLNISGLDKTTVQATSATTGITDHLLAVDANNNVKALKAAMPIFFYMPSVEVPTHEVSTGNILTGTQTIDLYASYTEQFGFTGGANQVRSNASSTLPTLPADELDYFITYFDGDVFQNVAVDEDGLLTYEVIPGAVVTPKTFMNIVFKVRD